MENLKRIGDPSQPSVTKRFRPEESPPIVDQHIDVHTVMSRMILNRVDFSKIIGKGGQMISSIRETCGAAIKGVDISEDMRLVCFFFMEHCTSFPLGVSIITIIDISNFTLDHNIR